MSPAIWVDEDSFREALNPVVSAIRDFAIAVREVSSRHGEIAAPDSPAMKEISDEQSYAQRSRGWQGPVTDTHSLGALTLRAAADYVRSFADALSAGRAPLYGHMVLARAVLESSVICWWLSEASIARDDRVKRGLSEYIYSAVEEGWLNLVDNADEHLAAWIATATALGWPVTDHGNKAWGPKSRGKPRVGGVGRPSIDKGIAHLLAGDRTSQIGPVQWSRLSAVSHVTFFGLRSAFLEEEIVSNPATGQAHVPVGTDAGTILLQAICVLRALRQAAEARFALMGWQDDQWKSAAASAENLERNLLQASQSRLSVKQGP